MMVIDFSIFILGYFDFCYWQSIIVDLLFFLNFKKHPLKVLIGRGILYSSKSSGKCEQRANDLDKDVDSEVKEDSAYHAEAKVVLHV